MYIYMHIHIHIYIYTYIYIYNPGRAVLLDDCELVKCYFDLGDVAGRLIYK